MFPPTIAIVLTVLQVRRLSSTRMTCSIVAPQNPAPGKPWVFHASPLEPDSAVALALQAKGFSTKVVMEGTGAMAGKSGLCLVAETEGDLFPLGPQRSCIPHSRGRHEVAKDLLVLQDCMNDAANIKGVKIITKYIDARTALDVEDIKDADAIIQRRTHPLFPPPLSAFFRILSISSPPVTC
jgi:hypothetical protein